MQLHIKPVWNDDDGLMQVEISLTGNGHQSWNKVYCYPDATAEFGSALISFPNSITDEIQFEIGSLDASTSEYLNIRAFVHDKTGHCAIQFQSIMRGNELVSASVNFVVPTEAASINEMGKALVTWSANPTTAFLFEGAGN